MSTKPGLNILFISPYLPLESGSGGIMRTNQLYKEIEHNYNVDFVLSDPFLKHSKSTEQFKKSKNYKGNLLINTWNQPKLFTNQKINIKIQKILESNNYDYIFVRYYSTAYWLGLIGLKNLIIDCDDCIIETNRQIESSITGSLLKRGLKIILNRIREGRYFRNLNKCKIVLFSKKNNSIHWHKNFFVSPNKIAHTNSSFLLKSSPCTYNILFIGLLNYSPNYTGLHHFITSIWPTIYKLLDAKVCLRVVGHGLPSQYRNIWSTYPGIEIMGFVDDINDAYNDIDLSIVPIYQGSGTHIKILEALIRGIPTVITPLAHRGFEETLKDGECILVAKNDQSFAEEIINLLNRKDLRLKQSKAGIEKVTENYIFFPGSLGLKEIMQPEQHSAN